MNRHLTAAHFTACIVFLLVSLQEGGMAGVVFCCVNAYMFTLGLIDTIAKELKQ